LIENAYNIELNQTCLTHTILSFRPSLSIFMNSLCSPHMITWSWTSWHGWLHQIFTSTHWC